MNHKTSSILLSSVILLVSGAAAQEPKPFATFMELPWRYVIGGSAGGKWLSSENAGKRLAAKTTYRVFTLEGEKARITAGKAAPEADVCMDVYMHAITPQPDPESPDAIGVNAPWNPQPRQPVPLDIDKASLEKALGDLLNGKGIKKPKVKLTQTLRVDLDGDGKLETLLTGQHFDDEVEHLSVKAGDYSLVFMRRLVEGQIKTQLLAGEAYPKADPENAPSTYELAGVLDLDGDGKLEVLVRTGYYEGGGMQVWQLKGDRLVKVLEMECGV
ncbi:hypothetical protein [Brevifollis gellanilyticus]|uniref:VCBS repeat-containing protein n=1 Tax=Brevifollis gellanilyticus TaxID=748831 RepID=A0A512MF23_9BACT|nr:hypothetical protein [Brevifollis gellanilyticus]GEP45344.1 hypothetical protein BGE01nite_46350 [Brevifollis gellanilyticus]